MNVHSREASPETESPTTADAVQAAIRFLRVLRYRKAYVLAALLVAGLLGAIYYFTATRIYKASAQLLVTQSGSDTWNTSMTSDGARDTFIPTYVTLISSTTIL
ncbi:MAG: Wzz/FepE/Etk N-terminal domain-containing protein, partial [Pirellulaceae bacterium]